MRPPRTEAGSPSNGRPPSAGRTLLTSPSVLFAVLVLPVPPLLRALWNCSLPIPTGWIPPIIGIAALFWPFIALAIGLVVLLIALAEVVRGRFLAPLLAVALAAGAIVYELSPSRDHDRNVLSDCNH
jgi:hypothetical protein